jgi:hypothetical protein
MSLRPSQNAATGIFRKLVEVWRVQPPQASPDEEAGSLPGASAGTRVIEIRHDWKQTATEGESLCILKQVNGIQTTLSNQSALHLLWM